MDRGDWRKRNLLEKTYKAWDSSGDRDATGNKCGDYKKTTDKYYVDIFDSGRPSRYDHHTSKLSPEERFEKYDNTSGYDRDRSYHDYRRYSPDRYKKYEDDDRAYIIVRGLTPFFTPNHYFSRRAPIFLPHTTQYMRTSD